MFVNRFRADIAAILSLEMYRNCMYVCGVNSLKPTSETDYIADINEGFMCG